MKFKVMALAALVGLSAMSAQASELPEGPHIVTSGTASVDAVPDIATLAIEVNVAAKDAATAKKQADERVAQYLSFLEQNQIAKKDISAANLRTQPDYDYQNGKSILKGYRAVRTVEVTLRQLDKLNSLLDGALKAGLNEIRSVSLGVAQPDAYKDKARKAAIDDAIHQAQALAAGFNRQIGAGLQRSLPCL
ncbi:oxidative stress defense protein [Salmonella enterica subsp. enterica serovar Newport str. A182RVB]|nr:oxidative stress defense protein [Salmonella enterica subsp. enterica serovar Newport str. A182RVB]